MNYTSVDVIIGFQKCVMKL